MRSVTSLSTLCALLTLSSAAPTASPAPAEAATRPNLNNLQKRAYNIREAIASNFPDPCVFLTGGQYWAFATRSLTSSINVQVAHSPDYVTWTLLNSDAFPGGNGLGAWVDTSCLTCIPSSAAVWAPDVVYAQNHFLMYYSAALASSPSHHCISAATSSSIGGPYVDTNPAPIICPLSAGGAIDAAGFKDVDGSRYLVYKIDGNSLSSGAPTPIMLQRLAADAVTPVGEPVVLIDHDPLDGPIVEAPKIVRSAQGTYVLFFSSNVYTSDKYDVSYAMAENVAGPYQKYGPLLVTGTDGLYAPGGASVMFDEEHMVFHAGAWPNRYMYTAEISIDDADHYVSVGYA